MSNQKSDNNNHLHVKSMCQRSGSDNDTIFTNQADKVLHTSKENIFNTLRSSLPSFVHIPRWQCINSADDDDGTNSDCEDDCISLSSNCASDATLEITPCLMRLSRALHSSVINDAPKYNQWFKNQALCFSPCLLLEQFVPDISTAKSKQDADLTVEKGETTTSSSTTMDSDISHIPNALHLLHQAIQEHQSGKNNDALHTLKLLSIAINEFASSTKEFNAIANARIYMHCTEGSIQCALQQYVKALIAFYDAKKEADGAMQRIYNTCNTAHSVAAKLYSSLGIACFYCGEHKIALSCMYAGLDIRLELFSPTNVSYSDVALSLNNCGVCLVSIGRFDEAFIHFSSAMKICWSKLQSGHPRCRTILQNLQKIRQQSKHLAMRENPSCTRMWRVILQPWEMPEFGESSKKPKSKSKKGKKGKKGKK